MEVIVSWCDKLASVPTVGLTLDWHFAPVNELLATLSPLLDSLVQGDKPRFNVTNQDAFSASIQTDDGFQYAFEPSKVVVSFHHRMRAKPVSGGAPVMQMLSQAQPFTKLLPEVTRRLIEATVGIPGARFRKVVRIGIVSTTLVDLSDAPPGIRRLIDYIGMPWNGLDKGSSFQVVGAIGDASGWTDRCIHSFTQPESPEEISTIALDWQRTFKSGHGIHKEALVNMLGRAEQAAVAYFEEIAEGNRFDEDVRSPSA
jgi:hypothetical protein